MFFYLSKILSVLIMPYSIALALIIGGAFTLKKRYGKKLLWSGIALLLFFSNSFISNFALHNWEDEIKTLEEVKSHEIGIVLTGVASINKPIADRTFFNKGADRITHALHLYQIGKIKKIFITGGRGLHTNALQSEAEALKDFLIMTGMPESDILIEDRAKNTAQNAQFSKAFFEENGISTDQSFLLITSAFHMYRAKKCFEKVGLKVETFPTDYYSHPIRFSIPSLLYPSSSALGDWNTLIKEWVGIVVYQFMGYL